MVLAFGGWFFEFRGLVRGLAPRAPTEHDVAFPVSSGNRFLVFFEGEAFGT